MGRSIGVDLGKIIHVEEPSNSVGEVKGKERSLSENGREEVSEKEERGERRRNRFERWWGVRGEGNEELREGEEEVERIER